MNVSLTSSLGCIRLSCSHTCPPPPISFSTKSLDVFNPVLLFPCSHDGTCCTPNVKKRKNCFLIAQNYLFPWTNYEGSTLSSLGRVAPLSGHVGQIWEGKEPPSWSHVPHEALTVTPQARAERRHWRGQC